MKWSHNDEWLLTADHAGYVKYWQANMNNVEMYQAHKEPIRGVRYALEPFLVETNRFVNYLLALVYTICMCMLEVYFIVVWSTNGNKSLSDKIDLFSQIWDKLAFDNVNSDRPIKKFCRVCL